MFLGKRIKELREEKGMVQRQLAAELEIDTPMFSKIKRGEQRAKREYIGDIYNAIVNQRVLRITYKPFTTNKELTFEIHPYHLKQFNNRWFLFGLNNEYLKPVQY
jgi:transcriptional regulator with XRE-family HTH domain